MNDINFINGAEVDTRPHEDKIKDFNLAEVVATVAPVQWKEKNADDWRTFPVQNQKSSGSCVAQTVKKLAGINLFLKEGTYVDFSATSIYQSRSNKPNSGMIGVESFEIWRKQGISLEALVPSQEMTDAQMDDVEIEKYENDIAKIFSISNHVGLANGDFDTVASTIQQTGKGVMTWFYFTRSEWSREFPEIKETGLTISKGLRHSVTAVDFGLIGGKEFLKIEDSAHFGNRSDRWVSRDFFESRNWLTRYGTTFQFQEGGSLPDKPQHTFMRDLEFSETFFTDSEVVALQDCLKYDGVFPADRDSTGYYGAITAKAVMDFQKKHNVASPEEIYSLQGRRVGPKTRSALNELFA